MFPTHRLHPQHTGRTESDAVVVAQPSEKTCSSCLKALAQFEKPSFHCSQCDYTVCGTCDRAESHPAHPNHKLYLITPTLPWRCDVCKCSSTSPQKVHCYQCETCDFSLCKKCFSNLSSPLHEHPLVRTDVRYVYRASHGEWKCDVCDHNNGPGHYHPSHCNICQFDLCDNCVKPWRSTFHPHPAHVLYKADSNLIYPGFYGGWRCDRCSRCFTPQENNTPFHCSQCEFDLCSNCMIDTSEPSNAIGFDSPRSRASSQGRDSSVSDPLRTGVPMTSRGNPIRSPTEEIDVHIGHPGPPDGHGSGECVICLERPKDATIVHGNTGHICCCMQCALELQRNPNPVCPICRASIDHVIKQYNV